MKSLANLPVNSFVKSFVFSFVNYLVKPLVKCLVFFLVIFFGGICCSFFWKIRNSLVNSLVYFVCGFSCEVSCLCFCESSSWKQLVKLVNGLTVEFVSQALPRFRKRLRGNIMCLLNLRCVPFSEKQKNALGVDRPDTLDISQR